MLFFVPNRTHRASQEVPDPLGKLGTMPDGGFVTIRANHPLASSHPIQSLS
jgi:hypothetical protein